MYALIHHINSKVQSGMEAIWFQFDVHFDFVNIFMANATFNDLVSLMTERTAFHSQEKHTLSPALGSVLIKTNNSGTTKSLTDGYSP